MKPKTYLILVATLLLSFLLVTQQACKKEEKSNQPPVCEITVPASGQEITKGEIINISVDASDSDGSIAEVRFFIDGVGKSSVTSFPYNYVWHTDIESTGNHTIKATSLDNEGVSTSDSVNVTVIFNEDNPPVSNFNVTPTSGTAPLTVNFTDQSTNNPTSWQWDFGDGNTSSQQNPSHTYNNNGTFTVQLIATNNNGSDTEIKADFIIVWRRRKSSSC